MTEHTHRAQILLGQDRHADARKELAHALAADPEDAQAHALLSRVQAHEQNLDAAIESARRAIAFEPENPYYHALLGWHLLDNDKLAAAADAARQAVMLDPEWPGAQALAAAIYVRNRNWQLALDAAERGLAADAEDPICQHFRLVALRGLGRAADAVDGAGEALALDPESTLAHVNMGWALIEQRQFDKAGEHFREALRQDPQDEMAKDGLGHVLKSTNFLYRWLLAFQIWSAKLTRGRTWILLIAFVLGRRIIAAVGDAVPALKPLTMPLLFLLFLFMLSTWIGDPLANLFLRLHPMGRYLLDAEQRKASTVFGILGGAAVICILIAALTPIAAGTAGIVFAGMAMLSGPIFGSRRVSRSQGLWYAYIALGVLGAIWAIGPLTGLGTERAGELFIVAFMVCMWWSIARSIG